MKTQFVAFSLLVLLTRIGPAGDQGIAQGAAAEQPRVEHPGGDSSSEQDRHDASGVCQDPVHPKVYTELEGSAEGTAYVMAILKPVAQEVATPEQRKASVKKTQDSVLGKMGAGEFKLVCRFETAPILVGHVNAAGLAKLAGDPSVVSVERSKIEAAVFPKLQSSADGTVDVRIRLSPVGRGAPTREQKKALVKEIQDRVLGKLVPGGFRIGYRRSNTAYLSVHINAAGLAKLATDSDVLAVWVPSLFVEPHLNESVPFIRADQVHGLGYTGAGVTVAVLDTGVDCSHPDVQGSCADGGATFLGGQSSGGAENDHGHGNYMAAIITSNNGVARGRPLLS